MSAILTPTAPVTPPPIDPHRWTIDEYRSLDRTGLFRDKKTMLLDGRIYVMPMPSPAHDTSLSLADEFLRTAFQGSEHHVRNQMGFDIGTANDPGPDLAVVPGTARDYAGRAPTVAALIVEVAVTSQATDTATKAELYAAAAVPEYWVIDVPGRRIHVFRDPDRSAYRSHQVVGPSEMVGPLSRPSATILAAELLP